MSVDGPVAVRAVRVEAAGGPYTVTIGAGALVFWTTEPGPLNTSLKLPSL